MGQCSPPLGLQWGIIVLARDMMAMKSYTLHTQSRSSRKFLDYSDALIWFSRAFTRGSLWEKDRQFKTSSSAHLQSFRAEGAWTNQFIYDCCSGSSCSATNRRKASFRASSGRTFRIILQNYGATEICVISRQVVEVRHVLFSPMGYFSMLMAQTISKQQATGLRNAWHVSL